MSHLRNVSDYLHARYKKFRIATGEHKLLNTGPRHGEDLCYSDCGMCGAELGPGLSGYNRGKAPHERLNVRYEEVRISPKLLHGYWLADCSCCGETLKICGPYKKHVLLKETFAVMDEAWKATGKNRDSFPSGFHTELPCQVDSILESDNRKVALRHAINTIKREAVVI